MRRRPSLRRRIALTFLVCDIVLMFVAFLAVKPILLSSQDGIQIGPAVVIEAAAADLRQDASGRLAFAADGRLASLRRTSPTLWLIARAGERTVTLGAVPTEGWAAFRGLPTGVETAEMRLRSAPPPLGDVAVERQDTAAGPAWIMVGGVSPAGVGWWMWLAYLVGSYMIWGVPLVVVLAVPAVLLATPFALRGLRTVTREAAAIGPDRPDARLSIETTPKELLPLTTAINAALDRLADELARKRRFIADVSHELRTPLAVLGMRIAALPAGEAQRDLKRSHARLADMMGQMLDAERLAITGLARQPVDLVGIARAVVADSAPLAIEAGYSVSLTGAPGPVLVDGEPHAIGRAVSNLFGNAIAHGGRGGLIEVRIAADASLDVIDEGPGIPEPARERVFEPFHREQWDRDGCGLGLHLVQEIMRAHGGTARILPGPGGRVRLAFPKPGAPAGA
jgi:signal transduction histidine kinase